MPFQYIPLDYNRNTGTIADIIARSGEARAAAVRNNGAINAGAIQNVGATAAGTLGGIIQGRQDKQQHEIIAHVLHAAAQPDGTYDPATVRDGLLAAKLADHLEPLSAFVDKNNAAILGQAAERQKLTAGPKAPTNEAEIALDAQNPNSPTQQASIAALDRLKPTPSAKVPSTEAEMAYAAAGNDPTKALTLIQANKSDTSAAEDARYERIVAAQAQQQPVAPSDLAWATAYKQRKLLGPESSAAAAADRQASTIAQQTAQQARTQTFAEQQAGRKELTEKVETPYQTAQTSANTLRDVVAAAQAGNKVAGSLQSLEATMSAIRAQGLNRINSTEIGVTANAGSLWDHIVGWYGKASAGQPVPLNIQKDMVAFADVLEKAAYQKYLQGHRAITKRYNLTDEHPLPAPGSRISVTAPDGSVHPFDTQAQADAFKKLAGIK